MNKIRVFSPAKINLFLKVLHKRKDGYHDILCWMQTVNLKDEIEIEKTYRGIRIFCNHPQVPTDRTNLAYRAARLFLKRTQTKSGVKIEINKKIPVAAGLGGGSSDAASVLIGLNRLLEGRLSETEMSSLAQTLGSDVPFFFTSGSALAAGRGEGLVSVELPLDYWLVLVNPGFAVSTRWAYTKVKPDSKIPEAPFNWARVSMAEMLKCIKEWGNDLGVVVYRQYPVVEKMVKELENSGALHAAVTGSGPTAFGIFKDKLSAKKAAKTLSGHPGWQSWVVKPIRSRY